MKIQYEKALQQLDEAKLTGTFYINSVSSRDAVAA